MRTITLAATAAALLLAGGTAFAAKRDCDTEYKAFLAQMSKGLEYMSANWLAEAGRKSSEAYAACKAGDEFGPYGVWQNLVAELEEGAKKATK
jgi:hypothetical protein